MTTKLELSDWDNATCDAHCIECGGIIAAGDDVINVLYRGVEMYMCYGCAIRLIGGEWPRGRGE
jgi:hypothetical protein